ncbi:secretin and TonB N terminus short domain protein [Burkholderia sp. Ac-20353]|nr:secretin and TonB N terminus short domain protein [Burkholderia sp. Ac-20353]
MMQCRAQEAGQAGRASVAGSIHLDIPAQSLARAMQAYSRVSDLLVMVDAALLDQRMSPGVVGDYSPQEALRHLLAGTGLTPQFTSDNSAVIVPSPQQQTSTNASSDLISAPAIDANQVTSAYALVIQARLTEALCQSPLTRPGSYRLAVQLWIGATGAVTALRLLGSTGDAGRDAAIGRVLRDLVFDTGPSLNLPQPVTILLRPENTRIVSGCGQSSQAVSADVR